MRPVVLVLLGLCLAACSPPQAQAPVAPTALPAPTSRFSASARPSESTPLPRNAPAPSRPSNRVIGHVVEPPVGILSDVDTEVDFVTPLASTDAIHDLAARLRSVPGIFELRGDEHGVTVIYDPDKVTALEIREAFARLGAPARNLGTEIVDPGVAAD